MSTDISLEEQKILQLEREANLAMQKGEIRAWNNTFLAEDTLQFPPNSTTRDKAGYSQWVDEFVQNENMEFSWEPTKAVVSEAGDMAYCYGTTLLKVKGAADTPGKYVSVWRKVDGEWRAVIEINNFDQ